MDEDFSWRTKLIKSNINIKRVDYDEGVIYFDFAYRPYSGAPQKWASTFDRLKAGESTKELAERIGGLVLELRKELEG